LSLFQTKKEKKSKNPKENPKRIVTDVVIEGAVTEGYIEVSTMR
jgi:hypothetical protein